MSYWPWAIFVGVIGACVGSFLNVVVYRLPAGKSLVHPPSSCPHCGAKLNWFDNVPVLAWFYLRGRCRRCQAPISFQYPAIEALTAVIFAAWFVICYQTDLRPAFAVPGPEVTWPLFVMYLLLFAALIAATLIDARLFIIPLEIPWFISLVGLIVIPAAVALMPQMILQYIEGIDRGLTVGQTIEIRQLRQISAAPLTGPTGLALGVGGVVMLGVANVLLRLKWLPRSFELPDQPGSPTNPPPDQPGPPGPEDWPVHPHPRRESLKEMLFLLLPIGGAAVGYLVVHFGNPVDGALPGWAAALGGVLLGYLGGGIVVWLTRLLGTLAFGKEAMGLGDVHLMAAVGAVCGWRVAVLAFFIAPFFGLGYALVANGLSKLLKREVKMIPYGPHLAVATFVVCIAYQPLLERFEALLGW